MHKLNVSNASPAGTAFIALCLWWLIDDNSECIITRTGYRQCTPLFYAFGCSDGVKTQHGGWVNVIRITLIAIKHFVTNVKKDSVNDNTINYRA